MLWRNVAATAPQKAIDKLEQCFWSKGAVSVTVMDAGDDPLYEPGLEEIPLWEEVQVVGLFEDGVNLIALEQEINCLGFRLLHTEEIADRQWEREWLQHFQPVKFGRRLWVCPHELDISEKNAVIIKLDPGLAFGTGTHATTRLCLEWLDASDMGKKRVLDFGCGSGILSIAACLLGAEHVVAVDHDPQALAATRENAAHNDVLGKLTIAKPEKVLQPAFDVVLANILAQPLIDLSHTLTGLLRPSGDLVLSGIKVDQGDRVKEAYRMLPMSAEVTLDGWLMQHYSGHESSNPDSVLYAPEPDCPSC